MHKIVEIAILRDFKDADRCIRVSNQPINSDYVAAIFEDVLETHSAKNDAAFYMCVFFPFFSYANAGLYLVPRVCLGDARSHHPYIYVIRKTRRKNERGG